MAEQSYNSFSGVDITAVFGTRVIGSMQGISYSVTREKAPIYTMGSPDPRAFSRGKRGIAGSLIFTMFDRNALLGEMVDQNVQFAAEKSDPRPPGLQAGQSTQSPLGSAIGGLVGVGQIQEQESDIGAAGSQKEAATPWYSDQIPPFDVTLSAANEYGAVSVMRIYGVEILNEGYGISIDDIVSEQQYTYVCRGIAPWTSQQPIITSSTTA